MELSVTSVSAAGNGDVAINIKACDGEHSCDERFVISPDAYVKMAIQKGECTTELYDALQLEAGVYAAIKRGMAMLGCSQCSRRSLLTKLLAKGVPREHALLAIERLEVIGYIDDISAAKREAERCVAKLWGQKRIRAALIQKGYSADVVDGVLFELEDEGVDFEELCACLIERKFPEIPTDRNEMQKLIASISRYGYDLSQIRSAIAHLRDN